MIRIETLNREKLLAYISDEQFGSGDFIPISKHRAVSHANNPRVEEEDQILFLAYEGETLVGYLGALPDHLFLGEKRERGAWLSCLWIDPNHRGKKIAQRLLESCFTSWGKRILVTEFTFEAKILYDKSKIFRDLQVKQGTRLYIRSDFARILPPKKERYAKMKPLLQVGDALLNLFLSVKLAFFKTKDPGLKVDQVKEVDDDLYAFINQFQGKQLFKRGKEELNWILNFPWILTSSPTELSRKYHFSSVDVSFDFLAYKFSDREGNLVAFVLLSKRNRTLKIPYVYFKEDQGSEIVNFIYSKIKNWKIKTFTTYNSALIREMEKMKSPAFHQKTVERHYIVSEVFGEHDYENFEIQDGDADCSFT